MRNTYENNQVEYNGVFTIGSAELDTNDNRMYLDDIVHTHSNM